MKNRPFRIIQRAIGLAAVTAAVMVWFAGTACAASALAEPAAVVCLIRGTVMVKTAQDESTRTLQLLDLLDDGAVVETSSESAAVVALGDGSRFEIDSNARVVVAAAGLEVVRGRVRSLAPVPALVRLSPIAPGENASVAGTGRIRQHGSRTTARLVLDPPTGSWVLADDLTLGFTPVEGYTLYRVTIERGWGETVFDIKTRSASLTVPGDTLEHGGTYHWSAETLDPDRPRLHAGAVFFTLGEEESRARAQMAAQVASSDDPSLHLLLAAVDHGLGLTREACLSLQAALDSGTEEAAVHELLRSFGCGDAP